MSKIGNIVTGWKEMSEEEKSSLTFWECRDAYLCERDWKRYFGSHLANPLASFGLWLLIEKKAQNFSQYKWIWENCPTNEDKLEWWEKVNAKAETFLERKWVFLHSYFSSELEKEAVWEWVKDRVETFSDQFYIWANIRPSFEEKEEEWNKLIELSKNCSFRQLQWSIDEDSPVSRYNKKAELISVLAEKAETLEDLFFVLEANYPDDGRTILKKIVAKATSILKEE